MFRFKRITNLILLLMIVFCFSQLSVFANETKGANNLFAGGSGTIDDPYLISDDEQLQNINQNLSAYYELMNDIEFMSSSFTPIGSEETPFTGVLNGRGYTISNLLVPYETGFDGMIRVNSGTIKNLNIDSSELTSNSMVYDTDEAFTGMLTGLNNGAIQNCNVTNSSVHYPGYKNRKKLAYIASKNCGTISKCSVVLNQAVDDSGCITYDNEGTIEKCFVADNPNYQNKDITHVGIAYLNNSTINDCVTIMTGVFNNSGCKAIGITYDNTKGVINRCVSINAVSSGESSGEQYGISWTKTGGTFNRCYYYNTNVIGYDTENLGTKSCSLNDMVKQSLYSGFNFDSVWEFREGISIPIPQGDYVPKVETGIVLSSTHIDMSLLSNFQLTATLSGDPLLSFVVWSSSDESVATVDESGRITKIGYGYCDITAKAVWGDVSAVCNVAVVKSIEECTISGISDKVYTGEEITQNIVVKNGTETVDPKFYTVTYKNNINAGKATVTIKGKNGFTDYVDKTFTINPRELSADDFEIPSKEFTGENQSPEIVSPLSADDYDVSTVSESAAGSYDVTITGKGNCTGTVTISFVITAKKLTSDMFTVSNATYNGTAQNPSITSDLIKGTDYTVAVDSAVNAGDYDVIITGEGNYSGMVTKTFTIQPATLSADMFEISDSTYTGSAIEPEITTALNDDEYAVKFSKNVNVGTAAATITGKGNYTGSVNKTFSINALTIRSLMFTIPAVTFTGRALEPAVTTNLQDGDYSVEYSNNVNAGTGTATITGTGNCTGAATVYFTIEKKAIAEDMFEVEAAVYDGTKLKPAVITDLTDSDYTVTYSNNTNAGNGVATIKGKGNYTGTIHIEFSIEPAEINTSMFTVSSVTYTGEALTPEIETDLIENDYTVSFKNNVNAGTATASFKGTGNYTGTVNKTFKVNPATIKSSMFTISDAEYTGSAIQPKITSNLTEDDYEVEFEDNTTVGTGKAIITGKGNYTGTIIKEFMINSVSVTPSVSLSATSYTYDGKVKTPGVFVKVGETTLTENKDFDVSYSSGRINVGTYDVTVTLKGNYSGIIVKTFDINKKANTLAVKGKTIKVKVKVLKKKGVVMTTAKAMTVSNARGKVSYKLLSVKKPKFKKYFTVNSKTGKVKIKKGLKKGTYQLKVNVKAAGNNNYKEVTKTVTIKLIVK